MHGGLSLRDRWRAVLQGRLFLWLNYLPYML